jgi:hypothetical protein
MKKLLKIPLLLLYLGFLGFCFYLGSFGLDIGSLYNAISHSLVYKIFFFIYLVWFLIGLISLPFLLYEGIKYYFLDLHKYNQKDESEYETKEIRDYINQMTER